MSKQVKITVKTEKTFNLPTLPNFIRDEKDNPVPIENFTDTQLREFGEKWTEELIRKAHTRKREEIQRINRELAKINGK